MAIGSRRALQARNIFPILLFLTGVALSAVAAWLNYRQMDQQAHDEFHRLAARTQLEISDRVDKVGYGLRGLRGLYAANQNQVSRADFRRFVQSRTLANEFPGTRGFGFIQRVERSDLARFLAAERSDGAPGFTLRQLNDKQHLDLSVIKYLEPEAHNAGAVGLDVGSEASRRAGIQQAINTGAATVTGAVTLVQDDKKSPGMLLYLPVYRDGMPTDVPSERRAALVGVLYAPIVMAELLADIPDVLSGMLDFEVVDAPINNPDGVLMYDADDHVSQLPQGAAQNFGRRYSLRTPLQLPGRSITLSMNSTPTFDASVSFTLPWLLLVGGSVISAMLALLLRQQVGGRLRAEQLAASMTHDLQIAVRDSEALLSTLNLHSIVSIADRSGTIIEANDAFCRISGYRREELIGNNHRIVNSGMQSSAFWADMWKTISSGLPWRGQVCNLAKNGETYWVDTLVAPFIGTDGKIEKYVSIRTDITAIKRAEEELRWRQSLLDKMSNSSPLGFLVVDNRTDDILYFNHRFCEIWGIEHLAPQMQARALRNNDILPACLPRLVDAAAFAETCKPLQHEDNRITLEDEIPFVNNVTIRRYTTQIRDAEDTYFGRFYIFEDVTERKRAEQELSEATRAAQAAAVSKGQFLANMSHEIRTPMNAIIGLLSLLQGTEMTPRQRDFASKAEGAAQSLLGLLNDILDFSKVEAGKMTLENEPFRIDKLLRNLSVVLSANVGNKNIEVLFDVDDALPPLLRGDAMRLQQVLINLGGNAVKFTTQGQVVLSLRQRGATEGAVRIEFAVQDTGIGIAPEHQAHIFSGFSQAEGSTTRRFGGTGLGLAISKRFVELMGGDIRIDSTPGVGSRFYFTLEMPTVAEVPAELVEPERPVLAAQRVLIVDDNPIAGDLMARMVAAWGWSVDLATTGTGALERFAAQSANAASQPYQLVVMDWQLPEMDGWETARHIRELSSSRDITQPTIIMVTGHGREMLAQRSEAEQSLLNGFLVKPITASMLYDAIVDARSGKASLRQVAKGRSSQRQLHGMRVLVVEDNLINQQVADELLSAEGAIVSLAANGRAGVEAVAAAAPQFDLVLMDVQMPVLDGYGATRAIRQELGLLDLPIIAMTANAMASDRDACLAAGMNEHVGKPFDMAKLVSLILRVTGFQAAPQSADAPQDPQNLSAALTPIDGLDLADALGRMSGMRSLYLRTARDFLQILEQVMPELSQLLDAADQTLLLRRLHTLKGNAATLGARALAETAAALESHYKAAAPTGQAEAPHLLTALGPPVETTRRLLQQAIAQLEGRSESATGAVPASGAAGGLWSEASIAALHRLAELLEADDLEALQFFAESRAQWTDLPQEAMEKLDEALQNLDLAAALAVVQEMLPA